jgi:hypothetical protein
VASKNYTTATTRRTLGVVIRGRDPNSLYISLFAPCRRPHPRAGALVLLYWTPPLPTLVLTIRQHPSLVGGAQAPASKDGHEEGMASDDSYSAPARKGDGAHESKREPS